MQAKQQQHSNESDEHGLLASDDAESGKENEGSSYDSHDEEHLLAFTHAPLLLDARAHAVELTSVVPVAFRVFAHRGLLVQVYS